MKNTHVFNKTVLQSIAILMMCALLTVLIPSSVIKAADAPAKASVKASAISDGTAIRLTISKTEGADGYYIYAKKPGETALRE